MSNSMKWIWSSTFQRTYIGFTDLASYNFDKVSGNEYQVIYSWLSARRNLVSFTVPI